MKPNAKPAEKKPKGGKHQKKDNKDEEESYADLTFCFQADIILKDELKKAEYIGTYTVSNSKSAMSKMIGKQIDDKLKQQEKLENKFHGLIQEKSKKVNLIEENEIDRLNKEIDGCATELKESTNDICKTLSENPDIPKNLVKAKRDQRILVTDLKKFFDDFVVGKWNNYDTVIELYKSQKVDVGKLREKEMGLFKELKKLNEKLAKEEAGYNKDQIEMNQSLLRSKKLLAKTKLEENIFINYEENHINALAALHKSNFKEEEKKMIREIEEKEKERERIGKLNEFVFSYLREQKADYERRKIEVDNKRSQRAAENEHRLQGLNTGITNRTNKIEKLTKDIQNYRLANDHLMEVAAELSPENYSTIHGANVTLPPITKIPEQIEEVKQGEPPAA